MGDLLLGIGDKEQIPEGFKLPNERIKPIGDGKVLVRADALNGVVLKEGIPEDWRPGDFEIGRVVNRKIDEALPAIIDKMIGMALNGDMKAAIHLLNRRLGMPVERAMQYQIRTSLTAEDREAALEVFRRERAEMQEIANRGG